MYGDRAIDYSAVRLSIHRSRFEFFWVAFAG